MEHTPPVRVRLDGPAPDPLLKSRSQCGDVRIRGGVLMTRAAWRLSVASLGVILAILPAATVMAGAGNPTGTASATVPNQAGDPLTVQLSGTWVWPEFTKQ